MPARATTRSTGTSPPARFDPPGARDEGPDGFGEITGSEIYLDYLGVVETEGEFDAFHPVYPRDALRQSVVDLMAAVRLVREGDWSALLGSSAGPLRTQMESALASAGFDEDSLAEIARSGSPGAQGVATRATTGAVLSAAAQNSHAEAAQSLERVERLVEMIPDMADLKESMDHNTRVTAELAIAMTRMWELEAIQTVGAGNAGVVDAATIAEERRYMDFTLPELRP